MSGKKRRPLFSSKDKTRKFTQKEAHALRQQDLEKEQKIAPPLASHAESSVKAPPPPAPRPGTERGDGPARPRKRKGCGCLSLLIFLLGLSLVLGVAAMTYQTFFGPEPLEDLPSNQQEAAAFRRATDNVHFLIVGVDDSGQEGSRSDTMILAIFRPHDKDVALLSLPRDSLVTIPGYGEDKLNAAYAYGGTDLLVESVENLLGTRVDHTIVMDFDSFPKIINAMGGIVIDVPEDMYYEDPYQDLVIDIKAGRQKLGGEEALGFVRWRGDGQGDLGRIERQQAFMQALGQKASHLWPWQALATALVVQHELKTDLSLGQTLRFGLQAFGMGREDIRSFQLLVDPQYINGVSYALVDRASIPNTIDEMAYGIPETHE